MVLFKSFKVRVSMVILTLFFSAISSVKTYFLAYKQSLKIHVLNLKLENVLDMQEHNNKPVPYSRGHTDTLYEPMRSPVLSLVSNCRVMGSLFHHMLYDIHHMLGH